MLGEERGDVPVGPDAEQQHVEGGHRPVVLGPGRGGQLGGVAGGGGLRVVAVGTVGGRHRVHPRRVQRHRVEQRLAGLGLVALRVAGGQEPLVAPPDVEPAPVDRVRGPATRPAPARRRRRSRRR